MIQWLIFKMLHNPLDHQVMIQWFENIKIYWVAVQDN